MILTIPTFINILLTLITIYYLSPSYFEDIKIPNVIQESEEAKKEEIRYTRYKLPIENEISSIDWYNKDTLIFHSKNSIKLFDINDRVEKLLMSINEDEYVSFGAESSNIFCTWKNKVKMDLDDIGTTIRIFENNMEIQKFGIIQTLKIDKCNAEYMFASNAFDFMEKSSYRIDSESGKVENNSNEVAPKIDTLIWKQTNGNLNIIEGSEVLVSIPFTEPITEIKPNKGKENFLVRTPYGYWVIVKQ